MCLTALLSRRFIDRSFATSISFSKYYVFSWQYASYEPCMSTPLNETMLCTYRRVVCYYYYRRIRDRIGYRYRILSSTMTSGSLRSHSLEGYLNASARWHLNVTSMMESGLNFWPVTRPDHGGQTWPWGPDLEVFDPVTRRGGWFDIGVYSVLIPRVPNYV